MRRIFKHLLLLSTLVLGATMIYSCGDDDPIDPSINQDQTPGDKQEEEDTIPDDKPLTLEEAANGYEYIDLGLPSGTLWARCNVGASKPSESGNYYAWGEVETKNVYSDDNYKWGNLFDPTKYYMGMVGREDADHLTSLLFEDDAARANMGGLWRTPSAQQMMELVENCTSAAFTMNGVEGRLFTSKANGNSIFLPFAGFYDETSSSPCYDSRGYYWTRTLHTGVVPSCNAYYLMVKKDQVKLDFVYRSFGYPIRATLLMDENDLDGILPVTEITLSETLVSIKCDKETTITATVLPENATNKTVKWTSSDTSIATVKNGVITAVAVGNAIITCESTDGSNVKSTCQVYVESDNGKKDGHAYVDLGLPSKTLWADADAGQCPWASLEPIEFPWFYKESDCDYWAKYQWAYGGSNKLFKYNNSSATGLVDNKLVMEPDDDYAHVKWGGKWHIPSPEDMQELVDKCTWEFDGNYFIGTGPNGNSIKFIREEDRFGNLMEWWTNTLVPGYPKLVEELQAAGLNSYVSCKSAVVLNLSEDWIIGEDILVVSLKQRAYNGFVRPVWK